MFYHNPIIKRTYFTMSEANISVALLIDDIPAKVKLVDAINNRYNFNWVVFTDTEIGPDSNIDISVEPDAEKVDQWKKRFKYIFDTTKDKYNKLLELYESQETNLLNKITSSTTNSFNDTPQNVGLGASDDYTSTYAKTNTEVDPGEIINRLENIRKNYKNIIDLWIREFDDLFGESTI